MSLHPCVQWEQWFHGGEKTTPSLSWMRPKTRGESVKCPCADLEVGHLGRVLYLELQLDRCFLLQARVIPSDCFEQQRTSLPFGH